MAKMGVFDYINSINHTKEDLMTGTENDDLAEKAYNPWMTNNTLSYFPDTIDHAQKMNMRAELSHRAQYYYLINSVRPKIGRAHV